MFFRWLINNEPQDGGVLTNPIKSLRSCLSTDGGHISHDQPIKFGCALQCFEFFSLLMVELVIGTPQLLIREGWCFFLRWL